MKESEIYISCEDDSMYRGREKNLKDSLVKIFNEKAGFDITVDVEYTEPVKEHCRIAKWYVNVKKRNRRNGVRYSF